MRFFAADGKWIRAFLWMALFPVTSLGQPVVRGVVLDGKSAGVPFCNVFLASHGKLQALTTTNDAGLYRLQAPDTGVFDLTITSIGFKKYIRTIRLPAGETVMDVSLTQDTVLLDQVIVQGPGPVQLKGDTVIYDAAYFAKGDEANLGDLLKKLPGVEVMENGKVKYQGKEVRTIKIENDDLFDNQYAILTRNLSPDLIEQVEVLQNYSDNRLLKGVEDSEDVALNLTLRKDRKQELFGEARAEWNAGDRYETRVNVVSLRNRAKAYLLASANSVGADPTGDVDQLLAPDGSEGRTIGDDVSATFLVPIAKPYIAEFKRDRYTFNQARFGSYHGILKPAKGLSVNLQGYLYRDEINYNLLNRNRYYTPTDTTYFNETASTRLPEDYANVQAQVQYEAGARTNMRYRFRFQGMTGALHQQSNLNKLPVNENLSAQTTRQDHYLTLAHRLSENTATTIDLRLFSDVRPQAYFIDGNVLSNYFTGLPASDTLEQTSNVPTNFWGVEWNGYSRLKSGKLGLRASFSQTTREVLSDTYSPVSEMAQNRLEQIRNQALAEGYYAWQRGKLIITPSVAIQSIAVSMADGRGGDYIFLNPKFGVRWDLSAKSRLSAVYSLNQFTSEATQLTTQPLVSNYNLLTIHDNLFRTFSAHSVLANYFYGGLGSGFTVLVNILYRDTPADYLTNTVVEPNFLVNTMDQTGARRLLSGTLHIDKYFTPILSNLKIEWNYSRFDFITSTEGLRAPTRSGTHQVNISLRSALPIAVNAHVGHVLQISSTGSSLVEASNQSSLFYLDIYLRGLQQRLNVTLHWERYVLLSIEGKPVFFLVDLNARYAVGKLRKTVLLLKGRNLMDESVFAQRFVSSQGVAETVNQLLPRYVMAGIEFRF